MSPEYFPLIANHLWQSTLLAGVAGLLTLALRQNHARVRHLVWLAASSKFLVPLAVLISLGGHIRWRTAVEMAPSNVLVVVSTINQPFATASVSSGSRRIAPSASNLLPAVLGGIWTFGFLGICCSWWLRWRRIRAAVRASTPVQMDIPIPAKSSSVLLEPGVFGLFRPVLLLPDGLFERLTPSQLKAVVAHELCHIRHRDNLSAAIHMFVETVFWFHPLVWWMGKRMVAERERACDEEVLRLGNAPRVYAEGILNVCKLYVESPLTCVSGVTGSNLKIRIDAILTGRIAERLNLRKKFALTVAGVAAFALPIGVGMMNAPASRAQSVAAAIPKFEVASIRPCKEGGGVTPDSSPGRLSTGCDHLVDDFYLGLIQQAYFRFAGSRFNPVGVIPIKGGPDWIRSELYEINAKAEGQPASEMMHGPMLQQLLEDRFKLKIHREIKEGAVYELTLVKGGSKLKPFQEGSCAHLGSTYPVPEPPTRQQYCKALVGPTMLDAEGSTLGDFSKLINLLLDRPVIDKTGLTGKFDIHLEFSGDDTPPALRRPEAPSAASDTSGPTIFAAIQEQLGLKLVPAKGPVESLVIDHVEKPSEN